MFSFTIASYKDAAGNDVVQGRPQLQDFLNQVATTFSNTLAGNVNITLAVTNTGVTGYAYATGGPNGFKSMPTGVTNTFLSLNPIEEALNHGAIYSTPMANLNLSSAFASSLVGGTNPNYNFDVVLHEMTHALGFLTYLDLNTGKSTTTNGYTFTDTFDSNVKFHADGQPYFAGANARAVFGADLPLAPLGTPSSISHLDPKVFPTDVIDVFGGASSNTTQHITESAIDIAIFRDLGYELAQTLAFNGGHSFLPGAGAQTITGVAEAGKVNTVVMTGKVSDFSQSQVGGHIVETSKATPNDVTTFASIDRVLFNDGGLAFDDTAYKIDAFYHAAFGRAPDLVGMGYWLNQADLGAGLATISQIFQSAKEFASTPDTVAREAALDATGESAQVARLYQTVFARTADLNGLKYWVAKLATGWSLENVATSFQATAEFAKTNPTTIAYVTHLYENALHREPDAAGLAYWTRGIDAPVASSDHLSSAHLTAFFSELSAKGEITGAINAPIPFAPFLT